MLSGQYRGVKMSSKNVETVKQIYADFERTSIRPMS